jgi:ATP-dependent DNA helicase DinG
VIEAQVHQQLRAYLRDQQSRISWPHHLTMARLVARALRLGRSALIQTGIHDRYPISYLLPMLMWPGATLLVARKAVLERLIHSEIPQLQQWLQSTKPVFYSDHWPDPSFSGLVLVEPEVWLRDRVEQTRHFPHQILTVIDGVDDLEDWVRHVLTAELGSQDWGQLKLGFPHNIEQILELQIKLTHSLFQHPPNPYRCHLLNPEEIQHLQRLYRLLYPNELNDGGGAQYHIPSAWQRFWQVWQRPAALAWAFPDVDHGSFTLQCAPMAIAPVLAPIWSQQPVVLIGGMLDTNAQATTYQQRIGLSDFTGVKFLPDRQHELLQLYLPDDLPLPNTPEFQPAFCRKIHQILHTDTRPPGLNVVIVGDSPLKAQVGTILAAALGSRVQVEKLDLDANGILVTGWEFWRQHQSQYPKPVLLAIATLPIPSMENPLVAGQVAYYKQQRQDWFRLYLLPTAIHELHRAIATTREHQGLVALFDSRVIHRSYGKQILESLSPLARMNYLEDHHLLQV